jgi:hypothetical protein
MRYFFHINNGSQTAEDEEGIELPTFLAALMEGEKIVHDLLSDAETSDLRGGALQIVSSGGLLFVTLPITPPALAI